MAKVTVSRTFVGTPEEMKEYAGQIPAEYKKLEKKMDDAEKNSYKSVITRGTVMEVSDKRAHELAALGVVAEKKHSKEDPNEKTEDTTNEAAKGKEKTNEKVADVNVSAEKNKSAGPNGSKK